MTFDPYPVELFARCLLALERQSEAELYRLLSSGVGRWRVRIEPPAEDARGVDPAPTVHVDRLDTGRSIQREIPEMAVVAELINPQRAVPAFLEATLTAMIELGAPRP